MAATTPVAMEDPERSLMYYGVRNWFHLSLKLFYSDFEVLKKVKFPPRGPVIVATNHTNSLVDAAMVLFSSDRAVRLTCKEPLLKDPIWGWMIRGVDSIGLKRRIDYGGKKQDNTAAMILVRKELRHGCCVGLFPEGVGRYRPYLSPLRPGVAHTAVDFVVEHYVAKSKQELGQLEDACEKEALRFEYIHILPLGVTYFRREMFRSAVCSRFGEPIRVDAALLRAHGLDPTMAHSMSSEQLADACFKVADAITVELRRRMLALLITASSWRIRVLAELAVDIGFPKLKRPPSMACQFVSTARQFADVFDAVVCAPNEPLNESGVEFDGDCKKEVEFADLRKQTIVALDDYFTLLYSKIGICDDTVGFFSETVKAKDFAAVRSNCVSLAFSHLRYGLFWMTVAMPGIILWMPMYLAWRWLKRETLQCGIELKYDTLAGAKMVPLMIGSPMLVVLHSTLFNYFVLNRFDDDGINGHFGKCAFFGLIVLPLLFLLSLWGFPQLVYDTKSLYSLIGGWLLSDEMWTELCAMRGQSEELLSQVVSKLGITSNDVNDHLDGSDRLQINNRRTLDWTHVLRVYDVPVDRFHLHQD